MEPTRALSELLSSYRCPHNTQGVQPRPARRICMKLHYLRAIETGQKTVDARLYAGKFRSIKAHDPVIFYNFQKEIACQIVATKTYKSIGEMLTNEGVDNCFPPNGSVEAGTKIFQSLTKRHENSEKSAVVALRFAQATPRKTKAVLTFIKC